MSDNTTSAVTSVTPSSKKQTKIAPAAAAPAGGAKTATRGRPALILKGGRPYKEAKGEAQNGVRDAKRIVQLSKAELKKREKTVASDTKAVNKASTAATKAADALSKAPKDAALKAANASAKNALKSAQTNLKDAQKDVAVQAKLVTKAEAAYVKAQDALNKVEAAKIAALN